MGADADPEEKLLTLIAVGRRANMQGGDAATRLGRKSGEDAPEWA